MGLRSSTNFITPCEVIREINDLCQAPHQTGIRRKLVKLEKMCKLMANEIHNWDATWNRRHWTEKNKDEKQDWQRRMNPNYRIK